MRLSIEQLLGASLNIQSAKQSPIKMPKDWGETHYASQGLGNPERQASFRSLCGISYMNGFTH